MAKRAKKKKGPAEVRPVNVIEAKEIPPAQAFSFSWRKMLQALVIAGTVLWIYWPALHGDWLWDDDLDITGNATTQSPTGLWRIWFEPGSQLDYYPIKASVQWVQWHLWEMDTLGYHLTNVALHIVSALLAWRLLSKFGLRLAWLGGLIFAVHPVQVESVAWIAELKNTLSLPPFLLAMGAWIDFEERGKARDFGLALGLFVVAMLCKPTMVMFPVVMLLYAWWKRGWVGWNEVKSIAPFFGVSLGLGLLTVWLQQHNAVGQTDTALGGVFSRVACAGLSFSFYFSQCFLPLLTMPIYPKWAVDPPAWWQFLPWPVFGGAVYWLWTKRRTWGRDALLGLGFFLFFLMPFLGLNAISYMDLTWVMDHFLYLPIIGLIGLTVAAAEQGEKRIPAVFRPYGIGVVAAIVAVLAVGSHRYAKKFLNEEALWSYELQRNPGAYLAYTNLGKVLYDRGRVSEAIGQFEEALRIDPDYTIARNDLGLALQQTGQLSKAMEEFGLAVRSKPNNAEAHYNLGVALAMAGRIAEAIEEYRQALRINPEYAMAHNGLGSALRLSGQLPEAIAQDQQALRINPDDAVAHNNLGAALEETGQSAAAREQFEQAVRIKPDYAVAHTNLGIALGQAGRSAEALEQFEEALRSEPDNAEAHNDLGLALLKSGRLPEAIHEFELAVQIRPDDAEAHNDLGSALGQAGRSIEAMNEFKQALRFKPDDAEAHYNLGISLAPTGQTAEAIVQFQEALRSKPEDVEASFNLANALLQSGQINKAIEQYGQVLRIKPDDAEAYNNLGSALEQGGRKIEALEQYRKAVQINPNFVVARNNLARLQAIQKAAAEKN